MKYNNNSITAVEIIARLLAEGHISREETIVLLMIEKGNSDNDEVEDNTDYIYSMEIDNTSIA